MNKKLLLLFFAFLGINLFIASLQQSPITYPDELCYISQARHFAQTGDFLRCSELFNMKISEGALLHSLILSPFYLFFTSKTAYHLIIYFNAIIFSTLVFPVAGIIKRIINNKSHVPILTALILLTPPAAGFTHTLMSEGMFLTFNIYCLYFYLSGLKNKKSSYKITAFIISFFAVFLRPFGFITLLSLIISEFLLSKKKLKFAMIALVAVILALIPTTMIMSDIVYMVYKKILFILLKPDFTINFLTSLKDQLNSFILATFLLPLLVFFTTFINTKDKLLKKIRIFLITFVILNFLISAQHLFGYLVTDNIGNLITRYINVSLVFIFIFGFTFLYNKESIKKKSSNIAILLILLFSASLYTLVWKDVTTPTFSYYQIITYPLFITSFCLPILILILFLFFTKRFKTIIISLSIIFITITIHQKQITTTLTHSVKSDDTAISFLMGKNDEVLYISDSMTHAYLPASRDIETLTDNKITRVYMFNKGLQKHKFKKGSIEEYLSHKTLPEIWSLPRIELLETFNGYDYVLTDYFFDLPKVRKTPYTGNLYTVSNS